MDSCLFPVARGRGDVVGIVEAIGSGRIRPFTGRAELLGLLGLRPLRRQQAQPSEGKPR